MSSAMVNLLNVNYKGLENVKDMMCLNVMTEISFLLCSLMCHRNIACFVYFSKWLQHWCLVVFLWVFFEENWFCRV